MSKCPFCMSPLDNAAVICPYCHAKKGYEFKNKFAYDLESLKKECMGSPKNELRFKKAMILSLFLTFFFYLIIIHGGDSIKSGGIIIHIISFILKCLPDFFSMLLVIGSGAFGLLAYISFVLSSFSFFATKKYKADFEAFVKSNAYPQWYR